MSPLKSVEVAFWLPFEEQDVHIIQLIAFLHWNTIVLHPVPPNFFFKWICVSVAAFNAPLRPEHVDFSVCQPAEYLEARFNETENCFKTALIHQLMGRSISPSRSEERGHFSELNAKTKTQPGALSASVFTSAGEILWRSQFVEALCRRFQQIQVPAVKRLNEPKVWIKPKTLNLKNICSLAPLNTWSVSVY